MSAPMDYTPEDRAYARELHAIGANAVREEKLRLKLATTAVPPFDNLDPWQQVGWFAIAREVRARVDAEVRQAKLGGAV